MLFEQNISKKWLFFTVFILIIHQNLKQIAENTLNVVR